MFSELCGRSYWIIIITRRTEPTSCNRYRVCRHPNIEGELYECPDGLIYDLNTRLCREKRNARDCSTFDCSKKFNEFVRHPLNSAYYAFCVTPPNRQIRIRVFKCKDDVSYTFSMETQKCEYTCKRRGEHVNREDCESYISCRTERGKYVWDIIKCPFNHYFKVNKCVPYQSLSSQRCTPELVPPASIGIQGTAGKQN